jgi:hypothetical protein
VVLGDREGYGKMIVKGERNREGRQEGHSEALNLHLSRSEKTELKESQHME